MYKAVQNNNLEVVQYYVKLGMDVNFQHAEIMTTVLIEAVRQGNFEIAQYLLNNGADLSIEEDFGGETALSLALSNKDKKIITLLRSHSKK